MPKISAPTVAEHRAAQRAALIRAAGQILTDAGVAGVIPRAVAERAGLARSSFYEYFSSRDDILAAVAIEAFTQWREEIDAGLRDVAAGDRLRAYIELTMRMTADGKHDIATLLQQTDISAATYEQVMAMHDTLLHPLAEILGELGVPDARIDGALVQGVLNAGMQLVTQGAEVAAVVEATVRILTAGLERTRRI